MVDDELPPSDGADPVLQPGPRRSTYTPPPAAPSYDPSATDDDALAGALTQEFQRWAPPTGPISTSSITEVVSSPTPEPPAAFVPSPFAASPTTPPAALPPAAPVDPAQLPAPPQRISLTDEQLLEAADLDAPEHSTGALLDLVERELALREVEARRVAEWEQQVRAADLPEADELVSQVRSQFTGVMPHIVGPPPAPLAPPAPPEIAASELAASEIAASTVAEQLATAPPPSVPVVDFDLATAPPPYGMVPSAAAPPPSASVGSVDDVFVGERPVSALQAGRSPFALDEPPEAMPNLVEPGIPSPPPTTPTAGSTAIDEMLGGLADPGALSPPEPAASASATDSDTDTDTSAAADSDTAAAADSGAVPAFAPATPGAPAVHSEHAPQTTPNSSLRPVGPPAGRVEVSALEPTPAEQRAGRSVRLFWLWFAVNASIVSVALGAVVLGLGVSLRQAVLATLIGVGMSFVPLGLGTLAGKWSGQPTMVVSRATFGTAGNLIPALLALVTRLAWAAALLWMLGTGVAEVVLSSGLVAGFGRLELSIVAAALGLVIAAIVSGFGFGMIAVVSAIVSVISSALVVGFIVLTAGLVDVNAALALPDGDWLLLVSGAVLVFSVVGLAWANSSGDLARYQAKGTYGSSAVLFAAFGATIPAFLLICWGAILAASSTGLASGLQSNPIATIAALLPLWYPAPLVAAVALSLLSAAALALYSSGFALLASGVRAARTIGVLVSVVLTGALLAVLIVLVPDASALFRDVVTTLAVPVAAWAGIFGAETMIRTRRVHSPSLLQSGGVYPAARWVNLVMLLVITAIGWGLSSASVVGLQWQGYGYLLLGVDPTSTLASSDAGVLVALLLALLTPIVTGIPALRRLQEAERAAAAADGVSTSAAPGELPPTVAVAAPTVAVTAPSA